MGFFKKFLLLISMIVNVKTSDNVQTRAFGGAPASMKLFPYQANLMVSTISGYFECSGTLISNRFVLTAAHCLVPRVNMVTVTLGAASRGNIGRDGKRYVVKNDGIIKHTGYSKNPTTINDIALLRLPEEVTPSDNIKPATLPWHYKNNLVGREVFSSGWGRTSNNGGPSNILLFIRTKVISTDDCQYFFAQHVPEKQICINEPGKSVCKGDSGGPAVIREGNKNIIVGITSYTSTGGCTVGYPQVLTRVSHYLNWIQQNTGIRQ